MTTATRVLHCGLCVRSEIDLHLPSAPPDAETDVELRWGQDVDDSTVYPSGTVIAEYIENGRRLYTAVELESGFLIRFPECGEFTIPADLGSVTVHRDATGRYVDLLPILAAGTVLSMLHGLRGGTMLHASAVDVDGRALAIAGRSGQGKSTLAALLCAAGAPLITDDVLALIAGPEPTCVGGGAELRLRPAASSLANDPAFRSRPTLDERTAVAPHDAVTDPLPLAAVVIPIPSRTATGLEIVQLTRTEPLLALLAFPRIAGWTRPEVLARQFATLAQIAEHVPIHRATIPWGPPFDESVATALFDLVRS